MTRRRRLVVLALVIAAGLAVRMLGPQAGLPFWFVKYAGSILWGAMVYLLVALAAGKKPRPVVVSAAFAIAVAVELFRLFHAPGLDAFRLTLAGALLLGRVFSVWNIAAYAVGILGAAILDRPAARRFSRP